MGEWVEGEGEGREGEGLSAEQYTMTAVARHQMGRGDGKGVDAPPLLVQRKGVAFRLQCCD